MRYCDEFDLLSASPIIIQGACSVSPVMLSRFKGPCGNERYMEYCNHLSWISSATKDITERLCALGVITPYKNQVPPVSHFDLFEMMPPLRELYASSLSYFIEEDILIDKRRNVFRCVDESGALVGEITRQNLSLVRGSILESNFISLDEDVKAEKFSGANSRSIFEKLRTGRQKRKAISDKNPPRLTDIISAVSARGYGYNILNIWDLSIYQLYDQFARISNNYQTDTYGLRWAVWGTESFDFSLWYSKPNKEVDDE